MTAAFYQKDLVCTQQHQYILHYSNVNLALKHFNVQQTRRQEENIWFELKKKSYKITVAT